MLSREGFNQWASEYEASVRESDTEGEYPFAGYEKVKKFLEDLAGKGEGRSLLDLGCGSGEMTRMFYRKGFRVTGLDFSEKMLDMARKKMPEARFLRANFGEELPKEIQKEKYDLILMTYSLHHLQAEAQRKLVRELWKLLKEGGHLLIGDVAFESREDWEACRKRSGSLWDGEEVYPVWEEWRSIGKEHCGAFFPLSFCAGVMVWEGKGQ